MSRAAVELRGDGVELVLYSVGILVLMTLVCAAAVGLANAVHGRVSEATA